jgi:acyl-CoA thioester hydrolase
MKIELPTLEQIVELPIVFRGQVEEHHLDAMGHMNIRHYVGMFDSGAWDMFASFGLTLEFYKQHTVGMFALEQHLRYVREVRLGEKVAIAFRVVGLSTKRSYFIMFMINETRQELSATFESVGSFADLTQRRTAPFPPEIFANIDALWQKHHALNWQAPLCGSISV